MVPPWFCQARPGQGDRRHPEQPVLPGLFEADARRRDGATASFIGVDGTVGGAGASADPVKATTPEALAALKAEGKLACGQVPLLERDGLCRVQTQAILRHVARKKGLDGGTARARRPKYKKQLLLRRSEACAAIFLQSKIIKIN